MNRFSHWLPTGLLILTFLAGRSGAAGSENAAAAFDLPQRNGRQRAQLADFKGHIVILDFFAYWCVPCFHASAEVETGIRQYYEQRNGNAHGIPVDLLAINLEASRPERTEEFIRQTGLKRVWDDLPGEAFAKYGGSGMPFLVIIDATGGKSGSVPAWVVYRKAGFEGVAKLRQVIESIGETAALPATVATPPLQAPQPNAATHAPSADVIRPLNPPEDTSGQQPDRAFASSPPAPGAIPRGGGEVLPSVSLDFATMWASDILLADELLEYRRTQPGGEMSLSLSSGSIALHYVPDSPIEQARDVAANQFGVQTEDRCRVNDYLTGLLGAGGYSGYQDYRSLWLNEHFRQLFSSRPGYEAVAPWGGNATAGLRWEYLPGAGFMEGDAGYQYDVISPGYDVSLASVPPKLERYRTDFNTISGKLAAENVLTRRWRALQEVQILSTTDRQLRASLQSSLNCAVTEHWVTRLVVSGTEETPHFEAVSASGTLERDWKETWFASLMARGYRDNGEIENALLAENTADPPLESFQCGLGLRWQGLQNSLKLFTGPGFTRYQPIGPAFTTFPHLYQNRDWFALQFAFVHEF